MLSGLPQAVNTQRMIPALCWIRDTIIRCHWLTEREGIMHYRKVAFDLQIA